MVTQRIRHFSRSELAAITNQIVGNRLPGRPEQGVRAVSAVPNYVIGCKMVSDCGREIYRYGQADAGAACILGQLHQAPVPEPLDMNLSPVADYGIGTRVIGLTLAAAPVLANQYAGGWLYVDAGPGQGECLRILSHPAALALANCLFTCIDALTIGIETLASTCSLVANPYNGVIIAGAPPDAHLVGVPKVTIPAGNFGWFKRRGPTAVLLDTAAAPIVNELVTAGATDPGSVGVYDPVTALCIVGEVMRTDVPTSSGLINLMLE